MGIITKTHLRTATIAGLALAAMVTGGAAANAAPVTHVHAPAATTTPDVGAPGEGTGNENVPAIAPDGTRITSDPGVRAAGPTTPAAPAFSAQGWIEVRGVAAGARIRSSPVSGTVIGTIPYGAYYWVGCKRVASDGWAWGWASHAGRYGWVRSDLWHVVQNTAPGGGGTPTVPWC
ncbi:hypothetical protein L3Q67_25680 [Saccharothrix sp. AJ9571]|nr:hypothetical protein L3Q67_25680 [Saccharothrix sp. AJ9571]